METYSFWQIDAFSRERYAGNAAAVVFDADGLDAAMMQVIARQMNLSETVFLCRPSSEEADYRARIFTPRSELPFAGHPTIAAAHAWYHSRDLAYAPPARLRQECGIGVVGVAVDGQDARSPRFMIDMAPPVATGLPLDAADAADMLGCPAQDCAAFPIEACSTGLPWMVVPISRLASLSDLAPDQALIESNCRNHGVVGLSAYSMAAHRPGHQVHVRSFAPGEGIPEDPVCGSGNGAVALHIARHVYPDRDRVLYTAEQGIEMGYAGTIHAEVTRDSAGNPLVRIGGEATLVMRGELLT